MNRRIALALIPTLLAQMLLPAAVLATHAEARSATLLICTGNGIKEIALDPGISEPGPSDRQPRAQHCCPCGVACQACALACADRTSMRMVYLPNAAFRPQPERRSPITVRAPPAHRPRAPPVPS